MMKNWVELKPSIVFECDDIYKLCEDLQAKGVDVDTNRMKWNLVSLVFSETRMAINSV